MTITMEWCRILISLLIVYTVVNTSKSEPNDNDNDSNDVEKRMMQGLKKLGQLMGNHGVQGAVIGGVSPFIKGPFEKGQDGGKKDDVEGSKIDDKTWKDKAKMAANGAVKGGIIGALGGAATHLKPFGKREEEADDGNDGEEEEMQRRGWITKALGGAAKGAMGALGKREQEAMEREMQRRGWFTKALGGAAKGAMGAIGKREQEAMEHALEMERRGWFKNALSKAKSIGSNALSKAADFAKSETGQKLATTALNGAVNSLGKREEEPADQE